VTMHTNGILNDDISTKTPSTVDSAIIREELRCTA
jgi:hypothetical protein